MSTIFALSSGSLPAAIAIFRISGPRSLNALRSVTRRDSPKPRYMFHTKLFDANGLLFDSAMAVYLPGPWTYTGEDTAELFVHGSRAVVKAVEGRLSSLPSLRHATAGEFTKRALLNKKLKSSEVYALGSLLIARTERQLRQANRALIEGDWLERALTSIRTTIALVADFGEHVESNIEVVRREIDVLLESIRGKRKKGEAARRVREGVRVVLAGRPNVGKSSILNALCGRYRAIVSPVPGTTRDTIEVEREMRGVRVTIEDTAGIQRTHDDIEEEGIRRTRQSLKNADVVVMVKDAREDKDSHLSISRLIPQGVEVIVVRNKADLVDGRMERMNGEVFTTATQEDGVRNLEKKLEEVVEELCPEDAELTLSSGLTEVERILEEARRHEDVALIGELVETAAEAWGRSSSSESLIQDIMKDFCIGK